MHENLLTNDNVYRHDIVNSNNSKVQKNKNGRKANERNMQEADQSHNDQGDSESAKKGIQRAGDSKKKASASEKEVKRSIQSNLCNRRSKRIAANK